MLDEEKDAYGNQDRSSTFSISTALKPKCCAQCSLIPFAALPSFMTGAIKCQIPLFNLQNSLPQGYTHPRQHNPSQSTQPGKEVLASFQSLLAPLPKMGLFVSCANYTEVPDYDFKTNS